jgi:hypothetical protein
MTERMRPTIRNYLRKADLLYVWSVLIGLLLALAIIVICNVMY